MSTILPKLFNPIQKILKAKFAGAPAIVTTEDLNRQLDIIDYRFENVERNTPIRSNLVINTSISQVTMPRSSTGFIDLSQTKSVVISTEVGAEVIAKGCLFTPAAISETMDLALNGAITISLYAKKVLVTSAEDTSKEISGAKFLDNTTYDAASHYVYKNEELHIKHGQPEYNLGDKELITILAQINFERDSLVFLPNDEQTVAKFDIIIQKYFVSLQNNTYTQAIENATLYFSRYDFDTLRILPTDTLQEVITKNAQHLVELSYLRKQTFVVLDTTGSTTFNIELVRRGGWIWLYVTMSGTGGGTIQDVVTSVSVDIPAPLVNNLKVANPLNSAKIEILSSSSTSISIRVASGTFGETVPSVTFAASYPYWII